MSHILHLILWSWGASIFPKRTQIYPSLLPWWWAVAPPPILQLWTVTNMGIQMYNCSMVSLSLPRRQKGIIICIFSCLRNLLTDFYGGCTGLNFYQHSLSFSKVHKHLTWFQPCPWWILQTCFIFMMREQNSPSVGISLKFMSSFVSTVHSFLFIYWTLTYIKCRKKKTLEIKA